jgi:hypothetical protein
MTKKVTGPKMREVVINKQYGGFGLSPEATLMLYKLGETSIATPINEYYHDRSPIAHTAEYEALLGREATLKKWREYLKTKKHEGDSNHLFLTVFSPDEKFVLYARDIARDNPNLVKVVKKLGAKANGSCSSLKIVKIPMDVKWEISEYDGLEHIAEVHQTWG